MTTTKKAENTRERERVCVLENKTTSKYNIQKKKKFVSAGRFYSKERKEKKENIIMTKKNPTIFIYPTKFIQ